MKHAVPMLLSVLCISCSLSSCRSSIQLESSHFEIRKLTHLGKTVNSTNDDYAPQVSMEGDKLFFTSNRPNVHGDEEDKLYASALTEGAWDAAAPVETGAGEGIHEGSVAFDPAHHRVYFVQCYMPDGLGDCDIYTADQTGNAWKNITNAGLPLNSIEWDCHPSVSQDGNTIYFASERHGGIGGSDIWTSTRKEGGDWTSPTDLGEIINTNGDEKTPCIAKDGKTLYFASNKHAGYGGYDLFKSVRGKTGWSTPVNLGRPINSEADDLFLVESPSSDTIYVSSNRSDSFGGFDIYMIVTEEGPPPPPEPESLIVRYTIRNAFTMEPVAATVTLSGGNEDESVLRSGKDGVVQKEIAAGAEYTAVATHSGFINGVETFFYATDESGIKERQLLLTPFSETERKIYSFTVEFDFNYSNIRPEERKHLDSAITLLTMYPNSTVVVSGHTDSVGTDVYNIKLGYSRAQEVSGYVGKYLKEKNVVLRNPQEIRTYGESEPIATNSTEEGRQRNRRVEIAIIRNE